VHFPQTSEYALRIMAVLVSSEESPLSSALLAERTRIPDAYLSKICRKLVVANLLVSRRGQGGGFRLARPAEEITLGQILEAVDFDPHPDRCVFGQRACSEQASCPLHEPWARLREVYTEWAEGTTLAKLG